MKSALRSIVAKSFLIASCSILSYNSFSQHLIIGNDKKLHMEAGVNFGPTFFLGDLGGNRGNGTYFLKDVNLELTKMMKGAFFTVYPNTWLGMRLGAQYTYVAGQDKIINTNGDDELWRKQRNLDFRSHMWEVYGAMEIFPVSYFNRYDEEYDPLLKPYGFVGGGIFHFNPEGSLKDANGKLTWYKLQPLRTEGQGMKEYPGRKIYKLTQPNVILGAGIKVRISEKVFTGTELIYRHTFTDYIDDVSTNYINPVHFAEYLSPADATIAALIHDKTVATITNATRYDEGTQRGNPNRNDDYFSCVLKLGIKIGTTNEYVKQTRCPLFY